jgi:hypothetical protein
MNATIRRPGRRPGRRIWIWIAALSLLSPMQVEAQVSPSGQRLAGKVEKPRFDFSSNDYVRARIEKKMNIRYFVGEPVVVPIVLSNHTQYPITIQTNFVPRSQLHVILRREGMPSRTYYGPHNPGIYSNQDLFLYPLEEHSEAFVIWSDPEDPSGLAFAQPGEYTLEISQTISVLEGNITNELNIGVVTVRIDPTPAEIGPVVKAMIEDGAPRFLQRRVMPPTWDEKMPGFLRDIENQRIPVTSLTPYLCLSYADHLQVKWAEVEEGSQRAQLLADEALKYYQMAVKMDSAFKTEAYISLIRYFDRLGLARPAVVYCKELLEIVPRDQLGKIGSSTIMQRYLINTDELDPTSNWLYFP